MACIILADGSRVDSAKVIGNGADGFVVRYEDHVLKIPSLLGEIQPSGEIEAHGESLEAEKEVYRRLQNVSGVAECLGCMNNGIRLRILPEWISTRTHLSPRAAINVLEMAMGSSSHRCYCSLP